MGAFCITSGYVVAYVFYFVCVVALIVVCFVGVGSVLYDVQFFVLMLC